MVDDRKLVQLYNEEDNLISTYIEYKRLSVYGRIYALLQPEDDLDMLVTFRIEDGVDGDSQEDEIYVYVIDDAELEAVEEAWQKLHS